LKLNGTHQHLVCTDDVNILGGSIHTIRKNTEGALVASKEVNAEVPKYMVTSCEYNVEQNSNKKMSNKSSEKV
jgi:hypothetical protein